MIFRHIFSGLLFTGYYVAYSAALGGTDYPRDADAGQSSYAGDHNLDPAVVDSPSFGVLWKAEFSEQERHLNKPLVYTPLSTEKQIVFLASTNNTIRTLDAETGELVNERNVGQPFLMAHAYCNSYAETLGVMGTPVIDPETDTAYFFAKINIPYFREPTSSGILNTVYYFFAVDVVTLEDREGFPILIDGLPADNDPRKYFIGGTMMQRPSVLQLGDIVYGGFGCLCGSFNVSGTVIGVDVKQKKVVTNFVTHAGPDAPFTEDWTLFHGGGPGEIWQAGAGLSTDGESIYFAVDDGWGSSPSEIDTVPKRGNSSISILTEAVIRAAPLPGGGLQVQDFFRPFDYQYDDANLGSGGVSVLDPSFGTPSVPHIAIQGSRNRVLKVLDLKDMGGYRQGPDGTDALLQRIDVGRGDLDMGGDIYGGIASYPLGGYIYVAPVDLPLTAYKRMVTDEGRPQFVLAGRSEVIERRGTGIPVVTSLKDKADSGIVWLVDPSQGLRAWHATPTEDGKLKQIEMPSVDGAVKYMRPAFGNGKVYVIDKTGSLVCLGTKS